MAPTDKLAFGLLLSIWPLIPGGIANTTAADEFSNDIAKWRKGEGVLYIPEGSRIELTRR